MRKCLHFLYEESYGFFFGEVGRVNDPEGLLQTSDLDKNFQVCDKLNNPSDIRSLLRKLRLPAPREIPLGFLVTGEPLSLLKVKIDILYV